LTACCWTTRYVTVAGQRLQVDNPRLTLTGRNGTLNLRNRIQWVDVPGVLPSSPGPGGSSAGRERTPAFPAVGGSRESRPRPVRTGGHTSSGSWQPARRSVARGAVSRPWPGRSRCSSAIFYLCVQSP
jgi:hypothetical protein